MTSSNRGLESYTFIVILGAICSVGVISNILVLLVIILNRKTSGITEKFICNLAVSDLLLAGVALPLQLNHALHGGYNSLEENAVCKIVMFLPMFCITSSICTMVAISFDRRYVIMHRRSLTNKHAALVFGLIWMLALAASTPQLYEYSLYVKLEQNITEFSCGSHGVVENFETIYAGIIVCLSYCLPLLIIIINYAVLGKHVWVVSRRIDVGCQVDKQRLKYGIVVTRVLALGTAVFALLWTPFFVLFAMEELTGTDDSSEAGSIPHSIKNMAIALSTISSPLLHVAFNKKFRKSACMALRLKKVGPTTTSSSQTRS